MKTTCANCAAELDIEAAGPPEPFNCPACGEFNDAPAAGARRISLAASVDHAARLRPQIAWSLVLAQLTVAAGVLWLLVDPASFLPAVVLIGFGLLSTIIFWLRGIYSRLPKP